MAGDYQSGSGCAEGKGSTEAQQTRRKLELSQEEEEEIFPQVSCQILCVFSPFHRRSGSFELERVSSARLEGVLRFYEEVISKRGATWGKKSAMR